MRISYTFCNQKVIIMFSTRVEDKTLFGMPKKVEYLRTMTMYVSSTGLASSSYFKESLTSYDHKITHDQDKGRKWVEYKRGIGK